MDLYRTAEQYAQMDMYFTGDFCVRSKDAIQVEPLREQAQAKPQTEECTPVEKEEIPMAAAKAKRNAKKELAAVAEEANACCLCGLAETRTNAVPGEGAVNARLVFVGEAPGADEDKQGRPFVGRAGQLLEKMINAMGLKREEVFICNILKCRPPGNRDPKPEEIIRCLPYLTRQLEALDPEVIVALGAHAARTLLNTNKSIGQLRGSFHEYAPEGLTNPIPLMATYHPAYLLRNYTRDARQRVWEDLKKVMDRLGLEEPKK